MRRRVMLLAIPIACAIWAGVALTRLERAQALHRRTAEAAAVPRLTASGIAIAADDRQAQRDLAQRIGDAGSAAGIRLSLNPIAGSDGLHVAALRLVALGSEADLLRFSVAVEHGAAPTRWTRWSIAPDGNGALRLSVDAAAPWRERVAASTGPGVPLAASPQSRLPDKALFAPSPITGETGQGDIPQLIGIAGRVPDDAVALLRLGDGTTRSLRPGEAVEGWTVAAIAADRVRLTRAGREHVEILPPTSADQ